MAKVPLKEVLKECKRRGIRFGMGDEFWYRMERDIRNTNEALYKDAQRVERLLNKYKSKSFGFGGWKKSIESVQKVLTILKMAEKEMEWVESEFNYIKKLG